MHGSRMDQASHGETRASHGLWHEAGEHLYEEPVLYQLEAAFASASSCANSAFMGML
jgi:hypothetical protein